MTAYIKKRVGKTGPRYLVYYRITSAHREKFAGSFLTKKDAQTRVDIIRGELAALRDPGPLLASFKKPPVLKPGLEQAWDTWAASKRRVGAAAQALYGNSKARWLPILGAATDPETVTVLGISAGLDEMLDELAPNTVRLYLSHLAMVLDLALPDGTPNPARSRKLELPSGGVRDRSVPSNAEWSKIVAGIAERSRLAVRLMECDALRVSEACGLEAGDVDMVGGQILVRREVTKTRAGRRWVPTPSVLLDELAARGGVGVSPSQVYYDLQRACEKAKVRDFGTHAFRRRRISLWYAQGVDGPQVARWAGHSKASESMDTYAFEVMDALADEWMAFWDAARRGRSAAPVRHIEVSDG